MQGVTDSELYLLAVMLRMLNQAEVQRLEAKLDEMSEADYGENALRIVS